MDDHDVANGLHLFVAQGGLADFYSRLEQLTPDKWQMTWTGTVSGEPDANPPDGYEAIGAWQPYAATEGRDGWRRPPGGDTMTPDLLDLARAVVASHHWRWMPGMLSAAGSAAPAPMRVLVVDDDGVPVEWAAVGDGREIHWVVSGYGTPGWCSIVWMGDALPDLEDPATLGCLLALYEETRPVRRCPDAVYTSAAVYGLTHQRTVAALVAALLSASKEVGDVNVR